MTGPKIDFDLRGDKEFIKALRELGLAGQKKVGRQALRKGVKLIADEIKANIAVESGALRRTVKVRSMKRSRVRIGAFVKIGGTLDDPYAPFVLYGTRYQQGQRTGRDALESTKPNVFKVLQKELWASLRKEVARIASKQAAAAQKE